MKININELQKKKPDYRNWNPVDGRRYWYIDSLGNICFARWCSDEVDFYRYYQENCYQSQEDAKYFLKNIETRNKLKYIAFKLNKNKIINWKSDKQKKYQITLNIKKCIFEQCEALKIEAGQVYCLNKDFLNTVLEKINENDLAQMFLSGI